MTKKSVKPEIRGEKQHYPTSPTKIIEFHIFSLSHTQKGLAILYF